MTNKEFFEVIKNDESLDEEIRQHAEEAIEKIEKAAETKRNRPSKTAVENEPLKLKIFEYLSEVNDYRTSAEIGAVLDKSTAKISSLCRQLVQEGKLESTEIRSNKRKVKGYRVPLAE